MTEDHDPTGHRAARTPRPRRKRKHPARSAKVLTVGLSASAVLAITAAMGAQARSAAEAPAVAPPVAVAPTVPATPRTPDPVVVIEHRIVHVTPSAAPPDATRRTTTTTKVAPRQAARPAPAAPTTQAPRPARTAPAPSNGRTGGSR